ARPCCRARQLLRGAAAGVGGAGRAVPAVRALAGGGLPGQGRRPAARTDGHGAGHRRRGRPQRPHGAAEGVRPVRLRLLHQLRLPQGRGADRAPGGRAALRLVPVAAAGPGRGDGGPGAPGGVRGLLRHPAARFAARGLGFAAVLHGGLTGGAERRLRGGGGAVRRRRGALPRALGRLPRHAPVDRVLAGPAEPDARPAGLPPHRRRLGPGPPGPL
ncbi:MAG: Pyridoxamine 5'-phosphate oxidase, partial [uncultured Friedmanniella sp.]